MFISRKKVKALESEMAKLKLIAKKFEEHEKLYNETKKMFDFLTGGNWKKKIEEDEKEGDSFVRLNNYI